jgi:hypothetical protein
MGHTLLTMAVLEHHEETNSPANRGARWARPLVLLVALAAIVGFLGGTAWTRHRTDLGGWHTAVAQTGLRQISIEYDGWTYGVSDSVDQWIDSGGTWHDSGWPECLRVVGSRVTVAFQARVVTIDGHTERPIVAIDCRGSASATG